MSAPFVAAVYLLLCRLTGSGIAELVCTVVGQNEVRDIIPGRLCGCSTAVWCVACTALVTWPYCTCGGV